MRTVACILAVWLAGIVSVPAATLLPNGEQTFLDANGNPLSGGKVFFYIPSTTTKKNTYKNSGQSVLNTNPVILDGAGRAIIYGSGVYRQQVLDSLNNLVWDQLTADTAANNFSWGGTTGGTANAQTITAPNFTNVDGQIIGFIAGFTNTGPLTLSVNLGTPINVLKDTTTGPVNLSGGEVVAGNQYQVVYVAGTGQFQLIAYPVPAQNNAEQNLASAPTTDLGQITSRAINVTGTATITSFGASANVGQPFYNLRFSGTPTLSYNATSLIVPGLANIVVGNGDSAVAQYLGSGNWKIVSYTRIANLDYLPLTGGTLTGALNLPAGVPGTDLTAVSRSYVPGGISSKGTLTISGLTVSSDAVNIASITSLGTGNYLVNFTTGLTAPYQSFVNPNTATSSLSYSSTIAGASVNVTFRNSATGTGSAPVAFDFFTIGGR
jgi:hypothetical protein